jgi:hypothetical protein
MESPMPATTETPKPTETPQALPRVAFASAGAMTPQARRRAAELARAKQPKLSAAGEIVRGLRPADHD